MCRSPVVDVKWASVNVDGVMYNHISTRSNGDMVNRATKHLRKDDVLRPIIDRVGVCTLAPRKRYFVALCEAVIAQQLAIKAAQTIFSRFCCLFPSNRPTPRALLAIEEGTLRSVGLSSQKLSYLRDLAGKFADGAIPYRRFSLMADGEVIETLTAVRGVGEWTAQMFLIFVLHRPDVWPKEDLGIKRAIQLHFGVPEKPDAATMDGIAEPWRPFRSIASWYLWQSLAQL